MQDGPRPCSECLQPIPEHRRSDAETCSPECHVKRGNRTAKERRLPPPEDTTDAQIRATLRPYFRRAFGSGRFRMRY